MTDEQLLQEYAKNHSEVAFKTLVERHVNTVYAAALRQVGNQQAAEEVTQSVFLLLSQKSASLLKKPFLVGWLYRVTHFAAKHARRSECQRQRLQSKIVQMSTDVNSEADSGAAWEEIAPILDGAMNRLREGDRNAILLRYFQEKSVREVGMVLGITEEAAKKRIARALGKLKSYFGKRGIIMPVGLIAVGLGESSLQAAPGHLVSFIAASGAGKITVQSSTIALAKGAFILMSRTKRNSMIMAGIALLLCGIPLSVLLVKHTTTTAAASPTEAADHGRVGGEGYPLPDWRAMIAEHPQEKEAIQRVWCIDNMRQIGGGSVYWARTHGNVFPKDLLALGEVPADISWHISPRYLTCPSVTSRTAVTTWAKARETNVSYVVVAQNVEFTGESSPKPFIKCPIHGHFGFSDGQAHWRDGSRANGGTGALLEHEGVPKAWAK